MSIDMFPKYVVVKCLNEEELNTIINIDFALPSAQVKLVTNINKFAKKESFLKADTEQSCKKYSYDDISNDSEAISRFTDHPEDMSVLGGPKRKKAKISFEVFHYLTNETKPHDRILMVENAKFYIQSKKLIKHSNYFRSLFTSDFKEKEQEIIPIKVFNAEKIKIFLDAVYTTDHFEITEDNLEMIAELFGFFEAVNFLIKLFKENEVFKVFSADTLIDLADKYGLNELKAAIEEFLIDKITKKYTKRSLLPNSSKKKIHMRSDEITMTSLELTKKYQLNNLKGRLEDLIIAEFHKDQEYYNTLTVLCHYDLPKLKEINENYIISKFNNGEKDEDLVDELSLYCSWCKMKKLKNVVETYILTEFHSNHNFQYIKYAWACNMKKVQAVVSDYIKSNVNVEPVLSASWKHLLFIEEDNDFFFGYQNFILCSMLDQTNTLSYLNAF